MKKISLVLVAALLLSASSVLANVAERSDPKESLSAQVAHMLRDNTFITDGDELTAEVRFTINKKHEIVVLTVDTQDFLFEGFVKAKLNYKKVDLAEYTEGRVYTLPVRMVG